jgi:superfamily II DNA or RNA helicase
MEEHHVTVYSLTQPNRIDAMAWYPYDKGLEAALTFISDFGDVVSMGVKHGDALCVPRQLAPPPPQGQDFRISRTPSAIGCKFPPRSADQQQAITSSLSLLKEGVDHVIEAPTGWGKTYVGSAIACGLGQPTLIVVTKQDLMDSWKKTLINLIGIDPKDIGIAQADKLDYKGKRFVLGMVNSLSMDDKYEPEFWTYFGLCIFDETHRMAAETFVKVCQRCPARHRLGLSATPKRSDGKTPLIRAHIGNVMVKGVIVPMHPRVLVKQTKWQIPEYARKFMSPGKMMGVTKAMGMNTDRNQLITDFVEQAFAAGRNIVVMADIIDHLNKLSLMIGTVVGGENVDFYIGGRTKAELEIASHKRVVMATYGMTAEGTDCPWWDTLVMASPRANVKQPVGRILRTMEGKKEPVVLDLVDPDKIMQNFYKKRLKTYYELGSKIVMVRS